MSVRRQQNFQGNQRVDTPHLRAIEAGVAGDFDALAGLIMAGSASLIVRGFDLATFSLGVQPETLAVRVAGSAAIHPGATASGSAFFVPAGVAPEVLSPTNPRVEGSFGASSVNYVGVDFRRAPADSTKDFVSFYDPLLAGEIRREVPLAQLASYAIVISQLPFSQLPALLPIAIVTTDVSGLISAVEDARPMLGRLASGGDLPDLTYGWAWPEGRKEISGQPFAGGDKAIYSLKSSLDAIMTRIWEIGGGERWSSAVQDRNLRMSRSGATFNNSEYFEWDGTNLHWRGLSLLLPNSGGWYNDVADQLVNSPGLTNLADGECIYVDADWSQNRSGGSALVAAKAPLQSLGTPAPSRSRVVLAWRRGSVVSVRDSYWPVGSDPIPDLRDSVSSFPLITRVSAKCSTSPGIDFQPLGDFWVTVSGAWTLLSVTSPFTVTPTGLAANTAYWIYAYYDTGTSTIKYEVSATGPDNRLRFKSGTTTHALISRFITDGTPDVVLYSQSGRHFTYDAMSLGNGGNHVLVTGTATVQTSVPLGFTVPTYASEVTLVCIMGAPAYGDALVYSAWASVIPRVAFSSTVGVITAQTGTFSLSSGHSFQYAVGVSGAPSLEVAVGGFVL
jgi:hypothetical protein